MICGTHCLFYLLSIHVELFVAKMVRKYRNQDYRQLKREAQRAGELFTDPEFPPNAASLFLSGKNERDIVWKRPKVSL